MSKTAVGKVELTRKDLPCPRDKSIMHEQVVGEATLDVCHKCGGQFFDAGEMFAAFGVKADPSSWDHSATGGTVKKSDVGCARCGAKMLAQDVRYEDKHVEVDRCGHCGGIWLDKGEAETIMVIGDKMQGVIEAEKAKARAELAAMGDVDFSPGLIAKFLNMFKKKG